MMVLPKAVADAIVDAMRDNFKDQLNCDYCCLPLGEDRREHMHNSFPSCVHDACRDVLMSDILDRSRRKK